MSMQNVGGKTNIINMLFLKKASKLVKSYLFPTLITIDKSHGTKLAHSFIDHQVYKKS